jgi:hypothetical protein
MLVAREIDDPVRPCRRRPSARRAPRPCRPCRLRLLIVVLVGGRLVQPEQLPGIGRGPTPGTHPNARRSPRGRRPPPPTPAAGPQQLRQLNAAWLSMRVRLPRNAIDSSRARTLTRIGVARLPQADQREVTTCRRRGRRSRRGAVGGGQRRSCPGRGGGGRPRRRRPARRCRSARRPRSRGHLPEQFGPVGQRLAALTDAGLHGQVARTGPCRVAAGQGPDGRTVMGRTARAAPS